MNDASGHGQGNRHRAMPVGLVTTCRTLLIIGTGRDIGPRIKHAKRYDWYKIHLMWPDLPDELVALTTDDDRFILHRRLPVEDDIARADVIIEDCNDHDLAARITEWSHKHRRLLNAIDKPEWCDLYYMSMIFRDPLILAITSGGDAPSLAVALRKQLEEKVSPGWSTAARLMAETRKHLPSGHSRKNLLLSLAGDERLMPLIESNDEQGIKDLIDDVILRM